MTDFILLNATFSSIIRVSIHGRMWLWTWNFLVQLQTFMNTYLDGEGGVFMEKSYTKIYTTGATVPLKIRPGHFATNHAHINYYIDVTTL